MASFQVALDWALQWEDPHRQYLTLRDAPPGAFSIAGVNSAAWPQDFATINALGPDYRPAAVAQFYESEFWSPYLAQIASDNVAKRVFDTRVNMGPSEGVDLLQMAINASGGAISVVVDGQLGPHTAAAANACNPDMLVTQLQNARAAHYRQIVAANPADAVYLNGWLARATA